MLATANSRKLHAELWKRLETFLYANYENPDIGAVKVMFAVVAAHRITDYPPAWLLVIAPSGSMKTEILRALEGLPSIHFVDEVTESTFISGKFDEPGKNKQSHPASLLHRIG